MKRETPILRLENSPLVFVVIQVKISPIFSLQNYLPQLQEELRKNGYPRFQRGITQQINFGPDFKPNVESNWRLEFYDREKTNSILLAPDSITLQTNSYTVFEEFERALSHALEILNNSVQISVVEGIGLRYVDWIRPSVGQKAESLLKEGLRGLNYESIGIQDPIHLSHFVGRTNLGQLMVRFYQQRGHYLPLDIGAIGLSYSQTIPPTELASLLEFDHQANQSFDFDIKDISDVAWKLHAPLDKAFRASVTNEAMKLWGAKDA